MQQTRRPWRGARCRRKSAARRARISSRRDWYEWDPGWRNVAAFARRQSWNRETTTWRVSRTAGSGQNQRRGSRRIPERRAAQRDIPRPRGLCFQLWHAHCRIARGSDSRAQRKASSPRRGGCHRASRRENWDNPCRARRRWCAPRFLSLHCTSRWARRSKAGLGLAQKAIRRSHVCVGGSIARPSKEEQRERGRYDPDQLGCEKDEREPVFEGARRRQAACPWSATRHIEPSEAKLPAIMTARPVATGFGQIAAQIKKSPSVASPGTSGPSG